MPRSLSNPEYNQFTQDNAAAIQALETQPGPQVDPAGGTYGQSKVFSWGGMSVLVYLGPAVVDANGDEFPNIYTSDVSDDPALAAISQPGYSAPPQSMLDTLPQATIDVISEDAQKVGALVNSLGQAIVAGVQTATSITPLVIMGGIILLALMYIPRGR